jgi:hypothetical protein
MWMDIPGASSSVNETGQRKSNSRTSLFGRYGCFFVLCEGRHPDYGAVASNPTI